MRTGRRGGADGAAILEAVQGGKLWVNLREADIVHPELGRRGTPPLRSFARLWAASVAMKKAGLVENRVAKFERSFELGRDDPAKMTAN